MRHALIAVIVALWAAPTAAQTSLLPTLQRFRSEYPTPMSPAQLAELLNRVAWEHRADGWGLLRKDSGNRCPAPQQVFVSCDFLFHLPTLHGFDVLIASDTDAIPAWQGPHDMSNNVSRFVAPVGPAAPAGLGDIPVPGEYDGDGQIDVAVYRTTTGEWFIAQGGSSRRVPWGAPSLGDVPVPADYDGDDRTDVAVYRASTGQWFILNSSSNTMTQYAFGSASAAGLRDMPLAGDYDRDGRADLGIYRRSTGEWFIRRSSDGGLTHIHWGAP